MDTIHALASGRGRAGVAVIRVSGPSAFEICAALAGDVPPLRVATLRMLRDAEGGLLDRGLVLTFGTGESFTGEAVVEFQVHGGPAVVEAVMRAIEATGRSRMARPGEFTRRALENGRLDLTQVQGLADLIDAETEEQRRTALSVADGDWSEMLGAWRTNLLRARALLEASLDFADEEVPEDVGPEVRRSLKLVREGLDAQLAGADRAAALRDGVEVAVIGPPNAGKSSLVNALSGRDAAIVSDRAGTTRDIIEVRMVVAGVPVTVLDTAGLREAEDDVEQIGVARARERAIAADLRVHLVPPDGMPPGEVTDRDLVLRSKSDLGEGDVSVRTGAGLDRLVGWIEERVGSVGATRSFVSRARDKEMLETALASVEEADRRIQSEELELAADELRSATGALERVLGIVGVEDVLGEIFSSFCIGK